MRPEIIPNPKIPSAIIRKAVVSNPQVPVRVRQALNIESGLNDGIMLPVILLLVSFAEATGETAPIGTWLRFAILQVVLGLTVGVAVGYIGGKLVELASRTGWMNRSFQDLSALGLSLLAYAAAELVGGNGFISAFCAGLTLGNTSRAICTCLYEFAEAEGQLLTLLIFTVFGAVMVPLVVERLDWMIVLYGFLSLTVIRMVPVGISLIGSRLRLHTKMFLGWFGPRGIASILFALLVVENSSLPGRNEILFVVVATVLLSVFSHGLTAYPAAKWYSVHLNKLKGQQGVVEHTTVTEMPTRLPHT